MTDNDIICGGWIWGDEKPDNIEALLEEAQPQGVKYKLIAYCGKQLVSGMNYLLICEKSIVAPIDAKVAILAVVLEEDLKGKHRIRPVTDIDLTGKL